MRYASAVCRFLFGTELPRAEQNFVGSPTEVAELCDVVQIFVADDEALLDIVGKLSPSLTAQHIVTAHCTIAPETMRAAAEMVERRGARFLDAPFTGSKVAAENGQLVYYIGGDEAVLKQVRPILEASSKDIILIGEIGDATVMKVATNLITAATAQVAAEALAIVRRAGISAELFSRAMKSNASNSTTIEMKVPMMMAGDFEAHFSVKHMLKDVRIGSKLARDFGLDLPVTEICRDMLLDGIEARSRRRRLCFDRTKIFSGSTKVAKPNEEALTERKRPAWALPAEPKPAAPPPSLNRPRLLSRSRRKRPSQNQRRPLRQRSLGVESSAGSARRY